MYPRTSHSVQTLLTILLGIYAVSATSVAQQPAPQSSGVTLKASSNLVVVDVVVTDKNNKPIHNLQTSDFGISENGDAQKISSFEEHAATPSANKFPPMPNLPPGVFTNYAPVQSNGPLNVILLDKLNTPTANQADLHEQVMKFLKTAHPGVRFAIFTLTNTHLALLQSFTADPELLRAALNNKKSRGNSLMLSNAQTTDRPESGSETIENTGVTQQTDPAMLLLKQLEAETASFQTDMRVQYTLNAMTQLARYLSNLPGRKNLIWFSGSFPISILPAAPPSPGNGGQIHNPFAAVATSEPLYRETVNLLSRSQVAVYPVDARGLFNPQNNDLTQTSRRPRSARRESDQQNAAFSDLVAEHSTMLEMAQQTGGRAFINGNDLSNAVDEAINSGSNYYTLSYSPTDHDYNGAYRRIQINLQQKGLNLAYRRGYYADGPSRTVHDLSGLINPPPDTVHLAMMHGSPGPTQIIFKTRILPISPMKAPAEATLAAGTTAGPDTSKSHGPYRNYSIDVGAFPSTIAFTQTPDGHYHAALECMTIAFNDNGALITSTSNELHLDLTPTAYQQLLRQGIQFHQLLSVPAKGDYHLRIGLHDATNDHVGALEFPLSTIKNLPPDTSAAATPPAAAPSQPSSK